MLPVVSLSIRVPWSALLLDTQEMKGGPLAVTYGAVPESAVTVGTRAALWRGGGYLVLPLQQGFVRATVSSLGKSAMNSPTTHSKSNGRMIGANAQKTSPHIWKGARNVSPILLKNDSGGELKAKPQPISPSFVSSLISLWLGLSSSEL